MKLKTATLIALIGTIASYLFYLPWLLPAISRGRFRGLLGVSLQDIPLIIFFFVLYRKQKDDRPE